MKSILYSICAMTRTGLCVTLADAIGYFHDDIKSFAKVL